MPRPVEAGRTAKKTTGLYLVGLAVALIPTTLRTYLLMPFPGSQTLDSIEWVYHLSRWLPVVQGIGALLAVAGLVAMIRHSVLTRNHRVLLGTSFVGSALLLFGCYRMSAPRLFQEIHELRFTTGATEEIPLKSLVMGIADGDQAKAYPLRLLAYHHQIPDQLGSRSILPTYCTMCRTGKIFEPVVDGRRLDFDLLGAVRYNSIYEDRQTGTWWYQANGKAAIGELSGKRLPELRADQMTLARWLELHPDSLVLQPDPRTGERYKLYNMHLFDERRSDDEQAIEWQWVVGVKRGESARAYPWSYLAQERLIQDTFAGVPLAIFLHEDDLSVRVWDRRIGDRILDLSLAPEGSAHLLDRTSGSTFGFDGVAGGGEPAGETLSSLPFVVEFWHSFEGFSNAELWQPPEEEPAAPPSRSESPESDDA